MIALRKIRSLIKAEIADPIERRMLLEEASTEQSLIEWSRIDDWSKKSEILEKLRVRALGRER